MSESFFNDWLERAEAERQKWIRLMNDDLFRDGVGGWTPPRESKAARMRRYLKTLWMALKGEDPYDYMDY